MKPVYQTILGSPGGNCFAACIASILELPIDAVPNFCAFGGDDWFKPLQDWLGERGLFAFEVEFKNAPAVTKMPEGALCIISGKSPRGSCLHSVVARGAWERGYQYVHDPMPGGGWLDGEPTHVLVLASMFPAIVPATAMYDTQT